MRLRVMLTAGVFALVAVIAGGSTSLAAPVQARNDTSFSDSLSAGFDLGSGLTSNGGGDESEGIAGPLSAPLCRSTMDYPHVSSGGGAVVAKARFTCDGDAPGTVIDAVLVLWVCTQALPSNYSPDTPTAAYGCTEQASSRYNFTMSAGEQATRYVPDASEAAGGAHGTGYWPACVGYTRDGGEINNVCSGEAPYLSA